MSTGGLIRQIRSKVRGDYYATIFETIKDKASSTEVFPEYTLSVSVGYAAVADFPDLNLKGLAKKADNMMYEDKEAYYKKMGIDRRRK